MSYRKTTCFLLKMPIAVFPGESNPDVVTKCQKWNCYPFNILEPQNTNTAEIPQDKWKQPLDSFMTAFLWEAEQTKLLCFSGNLVCDLLNGSSKNDSAST